VGNRRGELMHKRLDLREKAEHRLVHATALRIVVAHRCLGDPIDRATSTCFIL
jgi:hypothetical protein